MGKLGDRIKDLSGKTFGDWTAIEFVRTGTRNQSVWRFRCKCGNISEEYAYVIKKGGKKSCGCIKGKDITGMRFGRLVAIKNTGRQASCKKTYYWLCKCDCGNEVEVWVSNLMNGHTQSCGCYLRELLVHRNTTHGQYYTKERQRLAAKLHKEKYYGIDSEWTLGMEKSLRGYFKECVICGSQDDLQTDHVRPKSKGYGLKPGNAIRLCKFHNGLAFKGNKMPEELPKDVCEKILFAASGFQEYWISTQDNLI